MVGYRIRRSLKMLISEVGIGRDACDVILSSVKFVV
jgi:hypothetical protein